MAVSHLQNPNPIKTDKLHLENAAKTLIDAKDSEISKIFIIFVEILSKKLFEFLSFRML